MGCWDGVLEPGVGTGCLDQVWGGRVKRSAVINNILY